MKTSSFGRSSGVLRALSAHVRTLGCAAAGIAVWLTAQMLKWPAPGLIGWNAGVIIYLVLSTRIMLQADEHSIRRRAALVDESRFIVLTVSMAAICASFAGIVVEMFEIRNLQSSARTISALLTGATIILSWMLIHAIFAQHYAHEYFISRPSEKDLSPEDQAGLRFPGGQQPDYLDFLYFSFVIGVAAQTADVVITSRPMRRLNLLHCVLAFFFNATVLALTINLAASLIADGK